MLIWIKTFWTAWTSCLQQCLALKMDPSWTWSLAVLWWTHFRYEPPVEFTSFYALLFFTRVFDLGTKRQWKMPLPKTPIQKILTPTPKLQVPNPEHINQWYFIHWRFVRAIQTGYPGVWPDKTDTSLFIIRGKRLTFHSPFYLWYLFGSMNSYISQKCNNYDFL